MLFKKLWRTMGLYKAQFISMVIMITLGVGVFVGANMEWVSIEKNTMKFFEDTHLADYRLIYEEGFSEEDLDKIKDINGVENAARFISVNADIEQRDGDSVALTVTSDENVSGVMVVDGDDYDKDSKDGVWLSDKYADANDFKIGDKITFEYMNLKLEGKIKGLIKSGEYMICVRDESQLMPDYNTYAFAYISPAMLKEAVGEITYPQINITSDLDKKEITQKADDALGKTTMLLTKDEVVSYSESKGEAEEGKVMGSVIPVIFLLIALLTMVTTMHRLTAKEKTQIGTLKALGFKDRRILRHYTSYAFMIGVAGCILGTALGYLMAWYIMNPAGMMGTYFDMPEWKLYMPWFCTLIIIVIILSLTFIGFLSVRQMLKGTAADALRAYSPKKMKPMLIEKTKMFHRLSFGTRWNLRDVTRHKSRTAMSLIGITGCMIIAVCAFGMRDTMDAFLDMYYDGALAYSSRIYLSEEATEDERQNIIDKYDGDYSSSIGVQLKAKNISLDIYSLDNNKVKFPDKNAEYTDIKDTGAYVCMRLAKEYNLKAGDTFKVSVFGTDEQYTLKVAGIIRSVSENIVMSTGYADKLSITYRPDSVYTDTDKSDIKSDSAIKSIQSRQKIMDSFETFTGLMDKMVYIFVAGAIILGVVVLYNLGVMSYTERYREMATLKVVGFKDKKIGRLLISQNMWLTLVGSIIGLPLGVWMLGYFLDKLASEYEMKLYISPITYVISCVLTFGVSALVGFMVSRKNKHIDMVEALKGAE